MKSNKQAMHQQASPSVRVEEEPQPPESEKKQSVKAAVVLSPQSDKDKSASNL